MIVRAAEFKNIAARSPFCGGPEHRPEAGSGVCPGQSATEPASCNRAWHDGCGKDSSWKSYQLSHQFIRMHYKFRIGIYAEFMQIHALPLAIRRDAMRDDVT